MGTWGVPPARAGRAPHASRHNMAEDVAIELGVAVASVVAIAVALEDGLVVGVSLAGVPEGGFEDCWLVHALINAARPTPLPTCSSHRRLTFSSWRRSVKVGTLA